MRMHPLIALVAATAITMSMATAARAADAQVTISGRVLVGGTPAAGVTVGVLSTKDESACPSKDDYLARVTDADGDFTLTVVSTALPASSRITACGTALGGISAWTGPTPTGIETLESRTATRPFTPAQLASLASPIVIAADQLGRLSLTGLGTGRGTQVRVQTIADPGATAFMNCARKNTCLSDVLPAGRYRVQVTTSDTSGTWQSDWFRVVAGATQHVVVPPRATVTGRIAITGAAHGQRHAVNVNPGDDSSKQWGVNATKDGRYRLPDLFPGRYGLQVVATDAGQRRGVVPQTTEITVMAGQHRTLDLRGTSGTTVLGTMTGLAPAWRSYAGTVLVMRGQRVVQTASVSSSSSRTAPVLLSGVPKGTYSLVALAGDRLSRSRLTVSGRGSVRLPATLDPTGQALQVSGRITGAATADIAFTRVDGFGSGQDSGATTRHGRYSITGLLPGRYRVDVRADRHLVSTSTITLRHSLSRTFRAGAAYAAVTARLSDGVGAVTDAWVVPTDPTRAIRLTPNPSMGAKWPATSTSGRFTIYLAPGRYTTDFLLATRRDPNAFGGAVSPYALEATTPTAFTVKSGTPLDLGTITVATVN